jgi:hypothetical protein
MMNLIIGLCFGIAAAGVLVVMWRMMEKLRAEDQSGDRGSNANSPRRDERSTDAERRG